MPQGSPRRSGLALLVFLVVVVGVGGTIGAATAPGQWYAQLVKPPLNPPNAIFAPVWTVLYICVAVAGWRVWKRDPSSGAFKLWLAQLALNWLWSPVFFTLHVPWAALVVIAGLLGVITAFIARARRVDPIAAWLFVPYLAWVAFATYLNAGLAALN